MFRHLVTAVAACLLFAAPVHSTVIHIDASGGGDYETLQEGLDASGFSDTLLVASGLYSGPMNRDFELYMKKLTIRGLPGYDGSYPIIDCEGLSRAFYVWEDFGTVIEGFTIQNGQGNWTPSDEGSGGAILVERSYAPVIRDVVFVGNEADGWGAALHMREVWDVMEVTDCVFEGNTTINYGTLSCEGGTMLVTDCQFFGNDAECGGAIATRSTPGASHVTFTRCLISNNTALEAGAGAYVSGVGEATFIDCTFWENHLTYGWGGGVCVQEGTALLDGCTLHGNSADYGGGVGTVGPSTVTITNSIIAWGHGGGVVTCWEGSNVMITHSCVYGNFGSDSLCGDYHDNIRANPRFCEETGPDLTLHGESPCLPEGNPWGELIGAHGQGCGWPSPVEGSFYAVALGSESVRLRWAVEPVAGVESLIITRALSPEGPFVAVSDEPLQFVLSGNYLDSTVWPETTFWYELRVVFTDGIEEVLEPSPVQTTTEGHLLATLHPVSPNPFRDATSIQFDVAERAAHLVLAVYNVRGQLVRGLVDGPVPRGRHHAVWDGRDVSGAAVSSGVYFVRLESDREVLSQKLLFVK